MIYYEFISNGKARYECFDNLSWLDSSVYIYGKDASRIWEEHGKNVQYLKLGDLNPDDFFEVDLEEFMWIKLQSVRV